MAEPETRRVPVAPLLAIWRGLVPPVEVASVPPLMLYVATLPVPLPMRTAALFAVTVPGSD